jgi:hypothetical protein
MRHGVAGDVAGRGVRWGRGKGWLQRGGVGWADGGRHGTVKPRWGEAELGVLFFLRERDIGGVNRAIPLCRPEKPRACVRTEGRSCLSVTVYYTHPFRQVHRIIPGPNTVSYTYSYSDTYVYVCSRDCSVTVTVIHTYTYMYTVIHMYTYSYSDTYVQY